VKVGPANVYERPRTSSDVIMVAPEGMLLDVMKREGAWYWVYLPRDPNGTRRAGYIAAYQVELVDATGSGLEPGIAAPAGHDQIPPGIKRPPAPRARRSRYDFQLGVGGQFAVKPFGDQQTFSAYRGETGSFLASYRTPEAVAIDVGGAVRFGNSFALGADLWHFTSRQDNHLAAVVPHPFTAGQSRPMDADISSGTRAETDLHMRVQLLMMFGRRVDLALFFGPSVFSVHQNFIVGLRFHEAFPYDTPLLDGVETREVSKVTVGGNAGFDLTVMVWRFLGAGMAARYSYGSTRVQAPGGGSDVIQVGGAQVSAGLRVRF